MGVFLHLEPWTRIKKKNLRKKKKYHEGRSQKGKRKEELSGEWRSQRTNEQKKAQKVLVSCRKETKKMDVCRETGKTTTTTKIF